uniref:Uncharacterized protein n=1 Tax=Heterorhabditis bacteriophora TaxID=37862 RepID=A0A1I7XA74_HETBA
MGLQTNTNLLLGRCIGSIHAIDGSIATKNSVNLLYCDILVVLLHMVV